MKKLTIVCCALVLALGTTMVAAADTSTSIEEAFVDALGNCGGSSKVSSLLATTKDPGLKRALRYAIIVEAADDAAAVPGSDKGHSDCIRKELRARGVTTSQLEVIPDCVANDLAVLSRWTTLVLALRIERGSVAAAAMQPRSQTCNRKQ